MHTKQIEGLRSIVADESLAPEKRQEAARVLEELKANQFKDALKSIAEIIAKLKSDYAAYLEDQNTKFKVCSSCFRKQRKDRGACELCGAEKWEAAVMDPPNGERSSLIAAATDYSPEKLDWYIEHNSMDTAFAGHCAKILELRGIPRSRSFWEKAGLDFHGYRTT